MSLVLLFQQNLVSETNLASLSLVSQISVNTPATLNLLAQVSALASQALSLNAAVQEPGSSLISLSAAVQAVTVESLNLLAAVQRDATQTVDVLARMSVIEAKLLGINAAVQLVTAKTVSLDAAVSRVVYRSLGLLAHMQASPSRLVSLLSKVATDVHSQTLGLLGMMAGGSDRTLGINAYVSGATMRQLYLQAQVARAVSHQLGIFARASVGPVLNLSALVAQDDRVTLAILALIADAGRSGLSYRFLPDDDRIYEGWGHSPPPEAVARWLTQGETQYLVMRYVNYPNPHARADAAWIWDDTYLPTNGAELQLTEPVKETLFETVSARTLVVSETEYSTPRTTRRHKLRVTFPSCGIQLVKWLQMRLRTGVEFLMEVLLFDLREDQWEEAFTDPGNLATHLHWYWGTLPSWKPGTVHVRVNGVLQVEDGSVYVVHAALGAVEFLSARGGSDEVLVQYAYRPRVTVLNVDSKPAPGHAFNTYKVSVDLQEVDP